MKLSKRNRKAPNRLGDWEEGKLKLPKRKRENAEEKATETKVPVFIIIL